MGLHEGIQIGVFMRLGEDSVGGGVKSKRDSSGRWGNRAAATVPGHQYFY